MLVERAQNVSIKLEGLLPFVMENPNVAKALICQVEDRKKMKYSEGGYEKSREASR
jgi:hypothetical protein